MLTAEEIEALFTREDGTFLLARWGRPMAPVFFGVDAPTLATIKGAIEAFCRLAGHELVETDPELGANLMVFLFRDWAELPEVPTSTGWSRGWAARASGFLMKRRGSGPPPPASMSGLRSLSAGRCPFSPSPGSPAS